jgi:hypothetical protein
VGRFMCVFPLRLGLRRWRRLWRTFEDSSYTGGDCAVLRTIVPVVVTVGGRKAEAFHDVIDD